VNIDLIVKSDYRESDGEENGRAEPDSK